jgi:hypothetical protein
MERLKWVRDGYTQRTHDGRFEVRSFCMNPKWWGYWGLTDTVTGAEYPCRTEGSAKTAARNLRNKLATEAAT